MFRCTACGYIHDGAAAPEKCPRCGAAKEKFEAVSAEVAQKTGRARLTNALHADLMSLCQKMIDLAEAGLRDNLDPGCVGVFNQAKEAAFVIQKSSAAEIAVHVKKEKWG